MIESTTIEEIWSTLKEYIPAKERQEAADQLMPIIVDLEMLESDLKAIISSDQYLEEAAQEYIEDDEDDGDGDSGWN